MSTTPSYQEILNQISVLQAQAEQARKSELATAVEKVHALIEQYGLTQQDIFPSGRRRASRQVGAKVAPKYRDPASGATWTGRGKPPKWIEGKDRNAFLIA